jgi:hypothetical protein
MGWGALAAICHAFLDRVQPSLCEQGLDTKDVLCAEIANNQPCSLAVLRDFERPGDCVQVDAQDGFDISESLVFLVDIQDAGKVLRHGLVWGALQPGFDAVQYFRAKQRGGGCQQVNSPAQSEEHVPWQLFQLVGHAA